MANCVIVTTRCANENVDAYNRAAISATAIQNGKAVSLTFPTASGSAVFGATTPATPFSNVWLTVSPEVNKLVVGQIWGGEDPRNFTNVANVPFDTFRPQAGTDIIQVTKDFFQTNFDPDTIAGATVVELTATGFQSKVVATAAYAGISFKIGRKEPIVIASGVPGGEQVEAWLLECTAN